MNRSIINKKHKPLILIIDYNTLNIRKIKSKIIGDNYNINILNDNRFVFDHIKNVNPSLILLNKDMPDIDGFEICKLLKSLPSFSEIPILMILNKKNDRDINMCFESGATDYLCKPINQVELNSKIKIHIDYSETKHSQRELSEYILKMNSKLDGFGEIIPVCSYCKKVRDLDNHWLEIEEFILQDYEDKMSHGICPDCVKIYYPEYSELILVDHKS